MEETRLGGMIIEWQNGTDRYIDRPTDEKRASQTPPLLRQGDAKNCDFHVHHPIRR
jgi:hypothetical protein